MYLRRELCIPPSKATGVLCKAKAVKNKDELHGVTTFRWTLLSPSQTSRSERHIKGRAAIQQPFLTEKENTAPGKAGMGRNFCNLINSIFKKPSAFVLNKKRNILLNSEMLKGFPEKSEPSQSKGARSYWLVTSVLKVSTCVTGQDRERRERKTMVIFVDGLIVDIESPRECTDK